MEASAVRSSEGPVGRRTFATATAFQAKTCNKTEQAGSFRVLCLAGHLKLRWHVRETLLDIMSSQL